MEPNEILLYLACVESLKEGFVLICRTDSLIDLISFKSCIAGFMTTIYCLRLILDYVWAFLFYARIHVYTTFRVLCFIRARFRVGYLPYNESI